MTHKIKEELDLVRSVLEGYPPTIARAKAFFALEAIEKKTNPSTPEPALKRRLFVTQPSARQQYGE
jgi:hypothetical protein